MDNMAPPPNSSPEEIQAWNNMMDTMVTFIKASTNLMDTITRKVRSSAPPGPAPPGNYFDPMGGCEPECEACRPKPPCGICGVDAPPPAKSASSAAAAPKKQPSKPQVPAPEEPAAEGGQEEGGGEAEGGGETEGGAQAAEGEAEGGGEATEGEEAAAPEAPAEEAPPAPPRKTSLKPQASAPSVGGAKTKCICAEIRAARLEKEKKDKCNCRGKKRRSLNDAFLEEEEEKPPEQPPERVCGCGPTAGNTQSMVQEMVAKLDKAQKEITELQEELARLQRMDASKKVGPHAGPNPAALYKEIMKDSENAPPAQRFAPNVRQRLFQTNSSMDTNNSGFVTPANQLCFPCDDELSKGESTFGSTQRQQGQQTPQGLCSVPRPMMTGRQSNAYMGGSTTGMFGAGRPMMRPPIMEQATSVQSMGRSYPPQYYPGSQAPCRRTPSTSSGQSPAGAGYSRSLPPNLENTPDPNYWSRLGEYGSPGAPGLTEMTICSAYRSPAQESPPRRRIVCSPPPPRTSSGSCDPNCGSSDMR